MRSIKYYLNQALISVAVKCLERVEFKSTGNQVLHSELLTLVKRLRQGI